MSIEIAILTLAKAMNNLADATRNPGTVTTIEVEGKQPTTEEVEKAVAEVTETAKEEPAAKKQSAKKSKAKKPAKEDTVEEEPATEEVTDEPVEDEDEAPVATAEAAKEAAIAVRDALGKEATLKALKAFNAEKISQLEEENFGAFIRHCENMVEQGQDA